MEQHALRTFYTYVSENFWSVYLGSSDNVINVGRIMQMTLLKLKHNCNAYNAAKACGHVHIVIRFPPVLMFRILSRHRNGSLRQPRLVA